MTTQAEGREQAQRRADRIRAFREEIAALDAEGVLVLSDEDRRNVQAYQNAILARLAERFDVDVSEDAGRLSRGMRVVSAIGALALAAAMFSLVARFWGGLALPAQLGLLAFFPVASLAGVDVAARRERSLYVASIFAASAYATFWLAAVVGHRVLDVPVGVPVLWLGAAFGLSLGFPYGFRIVGATATVALILALAGTPLAIAGSPWTSVLTRLELPLMASGGVLMLAVALGRFAPEAARAPRVVAMTGVFGLLVALSLDGHLSVAPLSTSVVETVYQVVTFVAAVATIAVGLRWRIRDLVGIAAVALTVLLVSRYVDWFWTALPRYLFFSVLALAAFVWLLLLARWRRRMEATA